MKTWIATVNGLNRATPELSFPKALFFSACYFVLLIPSLTISVNAYMDLADPPSFDLIVNHSFLLSDIGGWLWFGAAFALPAFVLFSFSYVLRRIKQALRKGSNVVV
jgi:hypothetical protein